MTSSSILVVSGLILFPDLNPSDWLPPSLSLSPFLEFMETVEIWQVTVCHWNCVVRISSFGVRESSIGYEMELSRTLLLTGRRSENGLYTCRDCFSFIQKCSCFFLPSGHWRYVRVFSRKDRLVLSF